MDRLTKFSDSIKTGDLVTISSSQQYYPLRRNDGRWFIPPVPKSRRVKKGEAMIVVIDRTVPVYVEGEPIPEDEDDDSGMTAHEVIVFASGSACFFGLPRAHLCRY